MSAAAAQPFAELSPTVVVGHVEWVDFAVLERLPTPGEIVHASAWLAEAGGGGGVAAVQLARLAGHASFLTSIGGGPAGEATRQVYANYIRLYILPALV